MRQRLLRWWRRHDRLEDLLHRSLQAQMLIVKGMGKLDDRLYRMEREQERQKNAGDGEVPTVQRVLGRGLKHLMKDDPVGDEIVRAVERITR